ncbi:2-amino-4-hydroxy-6-hydroxymethyldihydropteridinediphosphokinase [Oscillospiraceae bacterium]|nr:2-amino-4-hydroxy-6-hydroxymethyldihydropteridinediphosphokinase [Oscillospiraceae bacterium]
MDMHTAYLSIGSNMGDREENLRSAIDLLNADEAIEVTKCANIYETEPVGYDDQPYFLNTCLELKTSLDPYSLLKVCQKIENDLHRVRIIRNGPRTIDLDILLYDDLISYDPILTIPHPRMYERAFVLYPLKDITDYSGKIPEDKSVKLVDEPYI